MHHRLLLRRVTSCSPIFVVSSLLSALFVGCGNEERLVLSKRAQSAPVGASGEARAESGGAKTPLTREDIEAGYIPQLQLSATHGFVKTAADTYLKVSAAQSASLSASQKCLLPKGKEFEYSAVGGSAVAGHRLVTFAEAPAGCALKSGYVYEPHVTFETRKSHFAEATTTTRFKARPVDSSKLDPSEWCTLEAGQKISLASAPVDVGSGHARFTLAPAVLGGPGALGACPFSRGYGFVEHFKELLEADSQAEFPRVMKHILLWEGGCSDHPNDPGGRTFKGITTERARLNGWTRDVCTMPETMVLDIYLTDYWNGRAVRYDWPLNLAIMNTEVNSGGGRAQIFLDRMNAQGVGGTLVNKASWYVDQQTAFYRSLSDTNASLRVFLTGWLNRSAYMQDVIFGRRSLEGEAFEPAWTAKTNDDR
ncbi:MAG: hypothetical protein IOD12_17740 [Silvanigrellales bacterium]|nr:hypothetical protein [Silvanigrellales bacterium]